ncbi:hypothetical protein JCM33374_g801 [Metschnikowia sp. JCM 33374]|nr:hypothetical protein JCM33374_g801 [Metschnikowia sp. JCM 33374]
MSINRIAVVHPIQPNRLPIELRVGESLHYRSSTARQSFSVSSREPKGPVNVHIAVTSGRVFVTSQRFIYITDSQGDVDSFSFEFSAGPACHFSHSLKTPWFGPNFWSFLFFCPPDSTCDGFPKNEWFEGKISFKDGGLFDFASVVDRAINDVVNNPHIDEDLPRYSST